MFFDLVFDEQRPLRGLMFFLLFLVPFPFSYGFFSSSFSGSMSDDLLVFWSVASVLIVYGFLAWVFRKVRGSENGGDVERGGEV